MHVVLKGKKREMFLTCGASVRTYVPHNLSDLKSDDM